MTQPLPDEPTSALDAQPKQVFETASRDLAAQGITIIWVTHDDAHARRVADRVCLLRDGQLTGAPPKGKANSLTACARSQSRSL